MLDRKLVSKISQLGLSVKESAAYTSLLSNGSSSVFSVSKDTGLNRATAYVVLDILLKKGLVKYDESKSLRSFIALPPDKLIAQLENEATNAFEKLDKARNLLPQLRNIYFGADNKQKVTFLNGLEGIQTVYEDTLTSSETILAFASIDNMHLALPDYFPNYYQRRASKGINIRSIHPSTLEAFERIKFDETEKRISALIPVDLYNFSPEINIYDNKVAIMSLKEKFALIIESQEIANVMKKIFELSWSQAVLLDQAIRQTHQ